MTVCFDPVARWAVETPDAMAIEQTRPGPLEWSYAAFHARIQERMRWLMARGVGAGDRVALVASNHADVLVLAFAVWRCGAIVVPLNWRLTPAELARQLAHAAPRVVIADAAHQPRVDAAESARLEIMSGEPEEIISPASDVAMLLYTSGSTGQPKAVTVTHAQLAANAVSTIAGWALDAADRALVATPLFHTAGWHAFTTPVLAAGGTLVLAGDFDAAHTLDLLIDAAVTRVFMVPTQLLMVQRSPRWGATMPTLRQWLIGGAPCPTGARDLAHTAGYPVVEAYGLTEFGPNCFTLDVNRSAVPPGTVGRVLPRVSARVVDGAGRSLPSGEVGELQLHGPQQCAGYWRDPDATHALFTEDAWIRTGDLASIDRDGDVRIAGRIKELFISGGEHVHPGEVERVLRELPFIEDVVVVAVPDAWWGEVGCAVVQLRAPLDLDALVRHARTTLAGYKVPKWLIIVEQFPQLGSGKIDRAQVAELAQGAFLREDSSMLAIPHDVGRA